MLTAAGVSERGGNGGEARPTGGYIGGGGSGRSSVTMRTLLEQYRELRCPVTGAEALLETVQPALDATFAASVAMASADVSRHEAAPAAALAAASVASRWRLARVAPARAGVRPDPEPGRQRNKVRGVTHGRITIAAVPAGPRIYSWSFCTAPGHL